MAHVSYVYPYKSGNSELALSCRLVRLKNFFSFSLNFYSTHENEAFPSVKSLLHSFLIFPLPYNFLAAIFIMMHTLFATTAVISFKLRGRHQANLRVCREKEWSKKRKCKPQACVKWKLHIFSDSLAATVTTIFCEKSTNKIYELHGQFTRNERAPTTLI